MDLIQILEKKIKKQINLEKINQIAPLSGSNTLLYDGFNFESEGSDHCPRVALMRRVGGLQEQKDIKGFISNNHGRTFEDFLRKILAIETEDKLEIVEEEEAEIKLEDTKGELLLTARPDKVIKFQDKIYPIEVKTIQSNSTAYYVFIKEKPKLGALIQIAIYLIGHNLEEGFILYCASNWFSGFAGKTRWKVDPQMKTFRIQLVDGDIYCNGIKTIVNYNKIIQGSYKFLELKTTNTLPNRPVFLDSLGEEVNYSGCEYCFASDACDVADVQDFNLIEFFTRIKELSKNGNDETRA